MSPNVPEAEGRARKLLSSFNEQLAMGDGYFACPGCTVRSSGNAKWVREANEAHECERLRDARCVLALAALARGPRRWIRYMGLNLA